MEVAGGRPFSRRTWTLLLDTRNENIDDFDLRGLGRWEEAGRLNDHDTAAEGRAGDVIDAVTVTVSLDGRQVWTLGRRVLLVTAQINPQVSGAPYRDTNRGLI